MKRVTSIAAAMLAAAVWCGPVHAQSNNIADTNTANQSGNTTNLNTDNPNTKVETGNQSGTWNVRHELAEVAEDALTKGDLKKLANRFVDADRDRIVKSADFKKDDANLDAKIDQINSAWKTKYGHEFKVGKTSDVFADATVKFGEMGRDAQLSSDIQKNSETANPADQNKTFGGKEKLEKGRDVATVSLPALGDTPAMTVPLIHELPASWKINVPDSMDAAKLRDNLSKQLDSIADSSKWSSDEKEAQAVVTRHILMAVLDSDNLSNSATGTTSDLNALPASSSNPPVITPPADNNNPPANK